MTNYDDIYCFYMNDQIEKGNKNVMIVGSFFGTTFYDYYKPLYEQFIRKEKIKKLKNENSTYN